MDRLIQVKVNGFHLTKDSSAGGVQGEANITTLRIEFDEGWDGFDKTIKFLNAVGELPVKIDLSNDRLVGERTYAVFIPGEALSAGGWLSFILEGSLNGVVQRSVESKLFAVPTGDYDGARYPEGVEGADTSAVFYAEYGVTTMDEIRAAFDAGKAVFAFSGVYGAGMIGHLVNISGEALFVCHDGMNNLFFYCNRAGWGEGYFEPDTTPVEISSIDVRDGAEAVTFTTTFSDGTSKVRVITKDADGNPSGMTDDGKAVAVTWTEVDG